MNHHEIRTILELTIPFCNVKTLVSLLETCRWSRTYIYKNFYLRDTLERENFTIKNNTKLIRKPSYREVDEITDMLYNSKHLIIPEPPKFRYSACTRCDIRF